MNFRKRTRPAVFGASHDEPADDDVLSLDPAAAISLEAEPLAAESRRAKAMAEDMLAPAVSAAARAGDVVQGVRDEIIRAGAAADEARETLLALRETMAAETLRLVESADSSIRTTRDLTTSLGRERSEMGPLAASLDAQAT